MSSVPLAALALRTPEPIDPLQQYGRVVQLKSLMDEQKIRQQQAAFQQQLQPLQLEQAQTQAEQSQLGLQSEKAIIRAYNESGGDINKALPLARQYGATPSDIYKWQNSELERHEKLTKLNGEELDNATKQTQVLGSVAGALLQVPAEQRQQALGQFAPQLGAAGIDISKTPPQQLQQLLSDDYLKHLQISSLKTNEQLTQNREQTKFDQEHGVIPEDKRSQINQALVDRYRVLNPSSKIPDTYQLSTGATVDDFTRIDKLMEQTEKAKGVKAQQDTANGFRSQTAALANLAAQEKVAQLNKPTADEQRRSDLADNLQENMDNLSDILKRRPDLFGKVAGRLTGLRSYVGTDDPDITQLEAIKHQLGMAQISAHGMRSAQGISAAAEALLNGSHNSPEATQAALDAASKSVQTFKQNIGEAHSGARTGITPNMVTGAKPQASPTQQAAPQGPPQGATHIAPGSDGKMHYTNAQGQDLGIAPNN